MTFPDDRAVARLRLAKTFEQTRAAARDCGLADVLEAPMRTAFPDPDPRTLRALNHVYESTQSPTIDAFLEHAEALLGPMLTVSQLRVIRRDLSRYLLKQLPKKPSADPNPIPKDLAEWSREHDVLDLLTGDLPKLTDGVSGWHQVRYGHRDWTVGRFLTHNAEDNAVHRRAIFHWLEDQALERKRATEEESERAYATRAPPEDPTAAALVTRIRRVRAALRTSVRPRCRASVVVVDASLTDENPPSFRYEEAPADASRWMKQGRTVTVPITLDERIDMRPICGMCGEACVHALGAIDHLFGIIFQEEGTLSLARILEAAKTPTWERWMNELDEVITSLEGLEDDTTDAIVWWSLDFERPSVVPFVQLRGKRGALLKPKRVNVDALKNLRLEPRDETIALRVEVLRLSARNDPRAAQAAFAELIEQLVGHPHVFVGDTFLEGWRVDEAPLGLTAVETEDGLEVRVIIGERTLSPAAWSEFFEGRSFGADVLIDVESEPRRVLLTKVDPRVTKFLDRWKNHAAAIPLAARAALVERLSRVALHVPIRGSGVIETTDHDPRTDVVFVITPLPLDVGLMIETRVRPLLHGPLFVPGSGLDEVTASTPERQIVRTTRDRYAELVVAREAIAETFDDTVAREGFTLHVTTLDAAMATVERLRSANVECVWPEREWRRPTMVEASSVHLQVSGRRDWFDVKGRAEVDDKRIELAMLLDAARHEQRYLRLGDGEFLELEKSLYERLVDLAGHTTITKHGIELSLAAGRAVDAIGREAESYEAPEAWTDLLSRISAATDLQPEPPSMLTATLRPYQIDGHAWLSRLAAWGAGAVLADDMGLGKTLQAIAVLLDRQDDGPALVVAPTSVCFNWAREIERFAPTLKARPYAGPNREQMLTSVGPRDVLIASYAVVQRDVELLSGVGLNTLVLDEAQALKNAATKRSRALRSVRANWTVALTGTPVENHPGELWALFAVVFPGLLGSWERFRREFLEPDDRGVAIASAALSRVVRPFVLRRTKSQVARDLPPRSEIAVDVVLSSRERALYDDARLAAVARLTRSKKDEGGPGHIQVLAALTRLRQLACHPKLVDPESTVPSSKLDRLVSITRELVESGRRALIFSQFTRHLKLVRDAIEEEEIGYVYLDGSTPQKERAALVDTFQAGGVPLFLISLKAGGTGLNLTAADTVIHLDPWWNPAVEDQATDRAHRIGQTNPVTVYRLVSRDTVEEQILELHEDKRKMVADILDGATQNAKLSTAELASLIQSG